LFSYAFYLRAVLRGYKLRFSGVIAVFFFCLDAKVYLK